MKGVFPVTGRFVPPRDGRRGVFPVFSPAKATATVELPGIGARAAGLTRAAGRAAAAVVRGRRVLRSKGEVAACLAACEACPDRRGFACAHCGCVLKFKARLATEDCPHPGGSRWPKPASANCQTSATSGF